MGIEITEQLEKLSAEQCTAVLGPRGTYTHQAALVHDAKIKPLFFETIDEVMRAIALGKCKQGIVPFENSTQGTVVQTLDGIYREHLFIQEEIVIDIHHCIAGLDNRISQNEVKRIYSHEQALQQCRSYLEQHYPTAKRILTPSTAAACRKIKEEGLSDALAIAPKLAVEIYGLQILEEKIQDESTNQTAFVVIGKNPNTALDAKKTLLVIDPQQDRVGLLLEILQVFKSEQINLSKIESRPSREKLGSYVFYVVLDSAQTQQIQKIKEMLEHQGMNVTSLGSYATLR